ncbi:hypothetical protein ACS0PU_008893 [Formica fusca]
MDMNKTTIPCTESVNVDEVALDIPTDSEEYEEHEEHSDVCRINIQEIVLNGSELCK